MQLKTHKLIIEKALNKTKLPFRKYLIKGVKEADDKIIKLLDHFYSPFKKNLLGNAKEKGLEYYRLAVKLYKKRSYKKAFWNLGYSLHLLTDLTVPAHSQLSYHYFDSDDLENYVEKNLNKIKIKKANFVSKSVKKSFETLAKISSKLNCKKNNLLISLRWLCFGKKDKLPDKELMKQAEFLLPLAIAGNIFLINCFKREVRLD